MECSKPDMVAAFRSTRTHPLLQRQQQDARKNTMNKVKQLYLDRRYKQCAALCEETLKTDVSELHSLHKTFLHFFAAICYESLGQAAHNYSSSKLPFLNLAKQAFASAKSTLPLPFLSDENGSYNSPARSPALTDPASSTTVNVNRAALSAISCESPTPATSGATYTSSSPASSEYSQDDTRPSSYGIPNFDNYSPRQPLQDINCLSVTDEFDLVDRESSQELRLCLKLDTPERRSNLAPKPLFIQKKSNIIDSPIPRRALPSVPLHSDLRTAQRQTGLQVSPLVDHYESLSVCRGTPHPHGSEHTSADSSLRLIHYNAHLSSFRTQLSAHLISVSDAISKTMMLQKEHKAKQSKRLASYWMLKPAAEGSEEFDRKAADKKERIDRLRQNGWRVNKERFGWKGEEYYRELRRRVGVELGGYE